MRMDIVQIIIELIHIRIEPLASHQPFTSPFCRKTRFGSVSSSRAFTFNDATDGRISFQDVM